MSVACPLGVQQAEHSLLSKIVAHPVRQHHISARRIGGKVFYSQAIAVKRYLFECLNLVQLCTSGMAYRVTVHTLNPNIKLIRYPLRPLGQHSGFQAVKKKRLRVV